VIQVYQERKNLAATLKDTKTVIGRLEVLIGFTVHLCFVFFYLLIFRVRCPKELCAPGVIPLVTSCLSPACNAW
jgi:hypothetical protein